MPSALLQTRRWVAAAAGIAQVAAAQAGMLPWWAMPVTVIATLAMARQAGPVDEDRARLVRGIAVTVIGAFALFITGHDVVDATTRANPVSTMRSLTEALVVLSLAMAPSWRTARDYRVWLCVTTGILIAAAVGSQAVTTDVLLVVAWVLVLFAMSAIQRVALAESATVRVPRRPPARRLAAAGTAPVLASLTAGALVFLALPNGVGGGLASHLVHGQGQPAAQPATRGVVGVDTFGDGTLDLLVRGALPNTPLVRVPADSPALWRGSIYTTYTGDSWQADPDERFEFVTGNGGTLPTTPIDPIPKVAATQTYRVEFANGLHSSLLWAPGVPLRVRGTTGRFSGVIRGTTNVRLIGSQNVTGYAVTAAVATTSPAELRAPNAGGSVSPMWTQLPAELPERVAQLAHAITAHAPDRYDQVADIETYLRSHETYSLDSPVPGAGQDAVADFLFRDHTGFCEQFASAAAVMLRTLGVPARVVTGLAYGTRQGQTRLLTAADAHAWVEVYYPGIGWSPTDPTAGVALAPTATPHGWSLTAALHRLSDRLPGGRFALIGLSVLVVLLLAATAAAVRGWAARRSPRSLQAPRPGPVLVAFHRYAARRRGRSRLPQETAREFVERVAEPGRLDAAVAVLEQECYGSWQPTGDEVAASVAAFDGERLR
ncbi:MAG TPA: transglutaminase-like domain-containing protein [Mycobacteriales bacterium]|nr:transglutaminase-like domain-containing protein [Mycobacteriales bacterium]